MTLDQYLKSEGVTAADFGARCNPPISGASISRIRHGRQNITSDVMLNIIRASQGRVTPEALLAVRAA
jgi:DNA-binding transcriptional regulator YdaS (Cro superfamily)